MLLEKSDAQLAQQAGYDIPVRLSAGVKAIIDRAVADPDWYNDWNKILWDILNMSQRARKVDKRTLAFEVIITGLDDRRPGEVDLEDHQITLMCYLDTLFIDAPEQDSCWTIITPAEHANLRPFRIFADNGLAWLRKLSRN